VRTYETINHALSFFFLLQNIALFKFKLARLNCKVHATIYCPINVWSVATQIKLESVIRTYPNKGMHVSLGISQYIDERGLPNTRRDKSP
jgi:hypothetical protein